LRRFSLQTFVTYLTLRGEIVRANLTNEFQKYFESEGSLVFKDTEITLRLKHFS
jgi:hypothetical protein